MSTKKMKLPHLRLDAKLSASQPNSETRTCSMVAYSGAEVLQFAFERGGLHQLRLSLAPGAVKLDRLDGGPFTKGHSDPNNPDSVIGKILNARVADGALRADVQFSQHHPDADRLWNEIQDGLLSQVSVEAAVLKMRETTEKDAAIRSWEATLWRPTAVALVSQAADAGARINAAAEQVSECEVQFCGTLPDGVSNMEHATNAAEDIRVSTINTLGTKFNFAALATEHIGKGTSVPEFRSLLIDGIAARQDQTQIRSHHTAGLRDERDGLVTAMSESLACRFTGAAPSERAREFVGARLSDLARHICQVNGLHASGFGAERFIRLAHSTSDYPELLQGTGSRLLLSAYEQAASPIKLLARASTADDFRAKTLLRLGEMPELRKVPESGEITHGTRAEQKETYRLSTFARQFSLTRQAQINDDLGAFQNYVSEFGQAAARLEVAELVALLAANGGLGVDMDDATPLFDASHNNLIGSGTAISIENLGIARMTMRLQTGIDGTTVLGIVPKYLVVNAEKETLGEQHLAQLAAAAATDANPFSNKLTLVCIPQLSAISATAWYLWADSAYPVLEYAHLSSQAGPVVEVKPGWDVLGTSFRCYLDFGCGAVGTRGAVLNPGA